jgi:death-on-curing family protein
VKDLPPFLTVEEVLAFHADQIREFGGSESIRDKGGLDSAVAQARATFDGEYLHKGVFEMAAAYAFHIAEKQPFLDGNKRTALNAAIAFLGLNGFDVVDPDGKLFSAMIGLSGGEWTKQQMAALLEQLASPWKDHD